MEEVQGKRGQMKADESKGKQMKQMEEDEWR